MLDLASLGSTHHSFAFGGVGFEVVAAPGVRWELSPAFARHAVERASAPVAATVRCSVRVDPGLPDRRTRGVVIDRADAATFVRSEELRAELQQLTAASYRAEVVIAPYRAGAPVQGPDAVVAGLSAAIVEQHAGVSLHAAAVELGGCAVLFVGPSGAGKSTAVRLIEDARVFAFDRVSIARDAAGGYTAWSLPRGTPVEAAWSTRRALPVAAIFRVRQARGEPRLATLDGVRALFAIRESTEVGDMSMGWEERRMNAIAELAARVVVGEIQTVLGEPHRARLHDFLIANAAVYACAMRDVGHVEH